MHSRRLNVFVAALCVVTVGFTAVSAGQQYRLRGVSPIFDGWETLADGTRLFYFGYINRNSAEVAIPVGPDNGFTPGQADRGQPTNFLPGRHEHVFTLKAPSSDPKTKLVWTVKSEMGAQLANASFDQLYILEERENEDPNAKPPEIRMADVTVKAGESIGLAPDVKAATGSGQVVVEGAAAEAAGLSVEWSKYRGSGAVTFSSVPGSAQPRTPGRGRGREGAEPPVGSFRVACGVKPAVGCGGVMARFSEPGAYVLRAAARQDGLQGLLFAKVTVKP